MGRMSELDLDLQQINSTMRTQPVPNHLISTYIAEMEYRLEAPYRARAIVGNFLVSLVLASALGFMLLVL